MAVQQCQSPAGGQDTVQQMRDKQPTDNRMGGTSLTAHLCPVSVCTALPVARSHTFISAFFDPAVQLSQVPQVLLQDHNFNVTQAASPETRVSAWP